MATEFRLSYTANEINEKLGKIKNNVVSSINNIIPDDNGNVQLEVSGGASSWNDLTDRPFYEEVTQTLGDTLTWDGSTDGRTTVAVNGGTFVKISNAAPTTEDCANGGHISVINTSGSTQDMDFPSSQCVDMGGAYMILNSFLSVPEEMVGVDFTGMGIIFPEAGLYSPADAFESLRLTINGYTKFIEETVHIKTIDEKFLPKNQKVLKANISISTVADGHLLVEDGNPTIEEVRQAIENDYVVILQGQAGHYIGNNYIYEDNGEKFATFYGMLQMGHDEPDDGRYLARHIVIFKLYLDGNKVGTIEMEEKYRFGGLGEPAWVDSSSDQYINGKKTFKQDSLIIQSSTAGSNKEFRISVDDSGVISAVEI